MLVLVWKPFAISPSKTWVTAMVIDSVSFADESPMATTPFYPAGFLELVGIALGTGMSVRVGCNALH